MKRLTTMFILLVGIITCTFLMVQPERVAFASIPVQTDSTYTTFTTRTEDGYVGSDTCHHEWFTTTANHTDSVAHTQTQIVSRQCVKCGKQTSTINTWTTYETDTTGGN